MPLIVRTKEDLIRKKKYQVTHALKSAKIPFYMNLFMNINFARNQHDTDRTKLEAQFY